MIKICSKLCNECPFSNKSMRSFLATYSINDFIEFMRYDILFSCHKHVNGVTTIKQMEKDVKSGKIPLCRGYVESMKKSSKLPKDKEFAEIVRTVEVSDESLTIWDFQRHHIVIRDSQ